MSLAKLALVERFAFSTPFLYHFQPILPITVVELRSSPDSLHSSSLTLRFVTRALTGLPVKIKKPLLLRRARAIPLGCLSSFYEILLSVYQGIPLRIRYAYIDIVTLISLSIRT